MAQLTTSQLVILEQAIRGYLQDHNQDPAPMATLLTLPISQVSQLLQPYVQQQEQAYQNTVAALPQMRAQQDAVLAAQGADIAAVLTAISNGSL
jgi:hypothetical protein